ncbi:MAG: DinB family protein [Paracoccaceae bacterium]
MDATEPFRAMAYNNAWANHRLLSAVARLDDAAFAASRTGFFPSLRATLNHLHVVDLFYVDALEGGRLGPAAWAEPEPHASGGALAVAQRDVDRRLVALAEALTAAALDDEVEVHRGHRTQRERRGRLMLHLFQHQIHHRGQAHAMLSDTAVAPPQLDEFFAAEEAPLRAADFATLGFAEDEIWARRAPTEPNGRTRWT